MPHLRAVRTLLLLLLVVSLVQAACAIPQNSVPESPASTAAPGETPSLPPTQENEPAPTNSPANTAAPSGPKKITFAFIREFGNLNPLYASLQNANTWNAALTQQLWNCWAWDFDDQNSPRPLLVQELPSLQNGGISQDGTVITLKLRPDIVWSDGQPITAQDFLFTYQMLVSSNNLVVSRFPYDRIVALDTPDERTVVIRFSQPFAAWLGSLWHGLLPAHILKPVFDAQGSLDNAEWNKAPTVGCGPYVFVEWVSGSHARFTANEKYWLGSPKIDEITIRFLGSNNARNDALKSGEGHLGALLSNSEAASLNAAGLKIVNVFSGYNEGWFFLVDPVQGHPALQDQRVRQAIAMGLDRAAILSQLLSLSQPALSYWDSTPYIDPSVQAWPYDPERARQLLDEAGWADSNGDGVRDQDGTELTLSYGLPVNDVRQQVQALAQQQLAAIGVKLETSTYDTDTFFAGYTLGGPTATGQLDIFEYSTGPANFPDPDTPDFLCSEVPSDENLQGVNWSGVCDQELDQLLQAQLTQIDFQARQQTFRQISKLIYERVYFLGLWQDADQWAISSRLQNVRLSGVTPLFNIMEWDLIP